MEKLAAEQRKETKRQFINAKYKDSVFRMAFEEKKYQLELYNALNGSDYDDPEAVEVTTLEDTFFIGMRNDLSFVVALFGISDSSSISEVYCLLQWGKRRTRGRIIALIRCISERDEGTDTGIGMQGAAAEY